MAELDRLNHRQCGERRVRKDFVPEKWRSAWRSADGCSGN